MRFFSFPRITLSSLLLGLCTAPVLGTQLLAPIAEQDPDDPMTYTFTAPIEDEGLSHRWTFGDGEESLAASPTHTFLHPGRYAVRAVLEDGLGEETELSTVVEAGVALLRQDFETQPPEGWTYDPARLSTIGPLQGAASWTASIIHPATDDSCVPPDHVPHSPPDRDFPMLGTESYSALIDTGSAVLAEGGVFTFFWMDDPAGDVVFETRIRKFQGQLQIGMVADDGSLDREAWMPLVAGTVRVEIHPWRATPEVPDGGGAHLRLLDPVTSETLGDLDLADLSNADVPWVQPVFGIFRSSFPVGSSGLFRLDELEIRAYGCLPPAPLELLGEWLFEDPTDPGFDSSGSGRHGTAIGGATAPAGVLELDGTGHLNIPSLGASLVDQKELTVEARVYVTAQGQMNVFRSQQPVQLGTDRFGVTNYVEGSGWETILGTAPVDRWYHVAGVFNQGVMKLYVDGVPVTTRTLPWHFTDGTSYVDWAVGARTPGAGGPDQHLAGSVDDVRLYARALSPLEILSSAIACEP